METTLKGEITNSCTCTIYDNDIGEYTDEPSLDCDGTCWEWSVEDFGNVTTELRDSNDTGWWRVSNLRLWDGEVSGYFSAENVEDILRGMTIRGEWIMRYEVFSDRIEYSLSHHDSPTGSTSVLTAISGEQREALGLY